MQMNIEMDCGVCAGNVFRAVGLFLSQDDGPSSIVSVDAWDDGEDDAGAIVAWDIRPTRRQVAAFRAAWNECTGLDDIAVVHDSPSSIIDHPSEHQSC
jgi:hypothetical protein